MRGGKQKPASRTKQKGSNLVYLLRGTGMANAIHRSTFYYALSYESILHRRIFLCNTADHPLPVCTVDKLLRVLSSEEGNPV